MAKRVLAPLVVLTGMLLAGCDMTSLTTGGVMRPAQLVDYQIGQTVMPTTAGTGMPSAFSAEAIPVVTWEEIRYADTSPLQRDFVQDALLQRSDVLCDRYLDGMYLRVVVRRAVLGEVSNVASAIGTFSSGAASAMALISTIANNTNGIIDTEVLQSQIISLIANQIRQNRARVLGQIMTQRGRASTPQTATIYPVSLALRDAQNYHQQCSFLAGVTGLTTASSVPNPASNAQSSTPEANAAAARSAEINAAVGISRGPVPGR